MKALFILALTILFSISCVEKGPKPILENPNWFLNGQPSPNSSCIDSIINDVIPQILFSNYMYHLDDTLAWWSVDTIGNFHGKMVVDLFFHIKKLNWDSSGYYEIAPLKAICIEMEKDKFRMIYFTERFLDDDSHDPTKIVTVDNTEILYTKMTQSGMAQYVIHMFWRWDKDKDAPIEMDYKRGFRAIYESESPNSNQSEYTIFNSPELKYYYPRDNIFRTSPEAKSLNDLIRYFIGNDHAETEAQKKRYIYNMDTIFYSHNYSIVEIGYKFECQTCRDTLGEIIAIQYGGDLYRPIYIERSMFNEENLIEPHLLFIGSDTVLIIDGRTVMIESYYDNFWIFSSDLEFPQPLYQQKVVETVLFNWADSVLAPDQRINTRKGYWDFDSLTFNTLVSYYDEKDISYTIGELAIKFDIINRNLFPTNYIYKPFE